MNTEFQRIIAASLEDRRNLFLTTANRLGTTLQNVEKDFWVCWVLDLLFNGRESGEPRLLFKGGTSLSKAYGLISRLSEDIDVTVFREDIGQNIEVNNLEKLSGKQQRHNLDNIKQACQYYIQNSLKKRLNQQIENIFKNVGISFDSPPVILDDSDSTNQTLLICYPSVNISGHDYIKPTIKIEAGAKSALDPHQSVSIKPYVSDDIPNANMMINNIVTIDAKRTFWDKVVILHGIRRWFDIRGELRHDGNRVSRHYYDIYKLYHSTIGQEAKSDFALGRDCALHAKMFFNSKDLDLANAFPGSFSLVPVPKMVEKLKQDYESMATMIFGEVPSFSNIVEVIRELEESINNKAR